ncbi:DUF6992 family protein [Rhodohalobacter halophilus]|uniref:DUF6992 family protein n=1 Tax=Rhodohalobacter halophilus TaxID=1812810 RepID=UPI00083F9328|nr:hypothetical protein [Rhodohalobacter halophilus]
MKKPLTLFVLIQLLCIGWTYAQSSSNNLEQINEDRIRLNSNGMLISGSWAVSNIVVGAIGMNQTSGRTRYVHQMNSMWNVVNLGIAGFGYYGLQNQSLNLSAAETLKEFHNFENILLFNAGLDVGYMALGAFMWERGLRKNSNRVVGYGQSMILQGGFLFTFDLVLYFLSKNQSNLLLENIQFTGNTLAISIPL